MCIRDSSTDGVEVYPYVFTVTTGSTTTTGVDLSCLSFNREVTIGESWAVNETNLASLATNANVDGSSDLDLREDAYLDALYGTCLLYTSQQASSTARRGDSDPEASPPGTLPRTPPC